MGIAALITWLVTASAGLTMLGSWISRGGHRAGSGSPLSPALAFTHAALAVLGLIFWIAYLASDQTALAWLAVVLLLVLDVLGFSMLGRTLAARRAQGGQGSFPVPLIAGHGAFAAATVVLALLSAIGVGN